MRKLLFFFSVIFLLFVIGCSSDKDSPIDNNKTKEYTVSLGLNLELNGSYTQLKSLSTGDVYGVQVYSTPNVQNSTSPYAHYAYGLFDDLSKMNIKLFDGYKYKFGITLIKDAKNILFTDYTNGGFWGPFWIMGSSKTCALSNSFVYTSNDYMDLTSNYNALKSSPGSLFARSPLDEFYGEVSDFVPSADLTSVSIQLKRIACGVKFIADGLTEGKLLIKMKDAPDITILSTDNPTSFQSIYNCEGIHDAWSYQETETSVYSESVPVSISWVKSDGVTVPLGDTQIVLQRNRLATFTIKVQDVSTAKSVTVTQADGELLTGKSYTIQSGTVNDVIITPTN